MNWILQYIFIVLWGLLFFIPGIIKTYSYAISTYIVDDLKRQGKNLSATEAITKSRRLMDGHNGASSFWTSASWVGLSWQV